MPTLEVIRKGATMPAVSVSDDPSLGPTSATKLDSWKEIAAYLKRDVATVRRWEKREALPIHRHVHDKLGSVFAYTSELDSWRESRRQLQQLATKDGRIQLAMADTLPWVVSGALTLGLVTALILWAPWKRGP